MEIDFEFYEKRAELKHQSFQTLTPGQRFNLIRRAYDLYMPHMMKGQVNPYFLEWNWTPIEFGVWCDIRRLGLPFYPQVPVLNYFLDFGDPRKKIAIEADGQQWHQNKAKDRIRDEKLSKLGWQVFRVPGYMCHMTKEQFLKRESQEPDTDLQRTYDSENQQYGCWYRQNDWLFERWALRSSEGLMEKIREEYYWQPKNVPGYESPFTAEYFNSQH